MGFMGYSKFSKGRFGNSNLTMPRSLLKFGLPSLLVRKGFAISTVGSKSMERLSPRPVLKIGSEF
jgi:hypothetical protein